LPPRTLANVSTAPALEPLLVRTIRLDDQEPLLSRLPESGPLAWVRHGEGLVGWGEAARLLVRGSDRFAEAVRWWQSFVAHAIVDDRVGHPGSGAVVFGSFAFDDEPTPSILVVPRVVVGRRDGRTWLTIIGKAVPANQRRTHAAAPRDVRYSEGALSATAWRDTVAEAVSRIRDGELNKVVLARDLLARSARPVDVRHLLYGLAERYPSCFTFSVDGLVGATPELLVRRQGDRVLSQVLAGTAWRREAAEDEDQLAAALLASEKDREEHAYAASSAADALAPYCDELVVPASPSVLRFANVLHLATEVTGRLRGGATALDLAGALHPTAAVCGTPTEIARKVIRDLERMDRGRYAGPVGWMDAAGDGEWGVALRCAEVAGTRLRLFAGCGIVSGSDPDSELAEAQAKLVPVRDALEASPPRL
jgi:menaquinone-specific isochorismate synthase